jgi:hypothetical protein
VGHRTSGSRNGAGQQRLRALEVSARESVMIWYSGDVRLFVAFIKQLRSSLLLLFLQFCSICDCTSIT